MDVVKVADYIAMRCEENRNPITNAKLNYLLYFVRDEFGFRFHKEIYSKGNMLGPRPSFHEAYRAFKSFGAMPIKRDLRKAEREEKEKYILNHLNENEQWALNRTVDLYAGKTMGELYLLYENSKPSEWKVGGKKYNESFV